jgi:hypothetical protein
MVGGEWISEGLGWEEKEEEWKHDSVAVSLILLTDSVGKKRD